MLRSGRVSERSTSVESSPPRRWFKRRKRILHAIPAPLKETMKFLKESSDVFPPLKSTVGGLCRIIELMEMMKGNKEDAERLCNKAEGLFNLLVDTIPDPFSVPLHLLVAVNALDRKLDDIAGRTCKVPGKSPLVRFFNTAKEKDQLRVLQEQLNEALEGFKLASNVRIEQGLSTVSSKTDDILHQTHVLEISVSKISNTYSDTKALVVLTSFLASFD